jgi:hypothetical protein
MSQPKSLMPGALGLATWLTFGTATGQSLPDDNNHLAETQKAVAAKPVLKIGEKRHRPNYDGRPAKPTDAADVLRWVPRTLLFPLYWVSEYVVRRPLGYVATWAEREEVPTLLINFFTFGEERNSGVIPTAFIDFGFSPSVGLYFFANELFVDEHDVTARVSYGGEGWLALGLTDGYSWSSTQATSVSAEFVRRPDWIYAGLGPESRDRDIGRYSRRDLKATFRHDAALWRSSTFVAEVGLYDAAYDIDRACCSDPSVQSRVDSGAIAEPTGHEQGFLVVSVGMMGALDTRLPRNLVEARPGSDFSAPAGDGVRVEVNGRQLSGFGKERVMAATGSERYQWIDYGASVAGFVDLTGEQRVLGLTLFTEFADPVHDSGSIPFDQLVSLGGPRKMRGFLQGRLRDLSATVATLEYRWPVWVWLDGSLHYAVGNVFGEHLSGWEARRLRSSFGIGVQSNVPARGAPFQLLLALGTRTFEESAAIDSVRIAVGSTHGF